MMNTGWDRFCGRILAILALLALPLAAQKVSPEQRTARYLDSVRSQPSLLLALLRQMPKGGDLHNHLYGAVYAESFIQWAAQDGLCVERASLLLVKPPCDASAGKPPAADALKDPQLYAQLVDAFSMRDWNAARDSGHDHFFNSFFKFDAVTANHIGDMMAEAARLAANDRVTYLELMFAPDNGQAMRLGERVGWSEDFAQMRQRLQANGLADVIAAARKALDEDEARMRQDLHCGTAGAEPGCQVTVRCLYQVLRGFPPAQVFAQILTGFELAEDDHRVVGLNLVMPEDWYVPRHDFRLHMKMIDYLHGIYPKVHISLHAGELADGMVPPEGMSSHIRDSVETGHAERIGHGVDVMHETDPILLLKEMARRNVLVEICLTSNDLILGVRGNQHPLPIYMKYGVPVALATDDEGVSRSDMTHEYVRAVEGYNLSYAQLKDMARNSLEHSFLRGASLWKDARSFRLVSACAADSPANSSLSSTCRKFLDASHRAQVEWREEGEFAKFEATF
jgi:adenosine deaminase